MTAISLSPSITECQVIDPMSIPANYITPVKVARVALYSLASVPMLVGGATFIAGVSGIVTWPLALLSIPYLAISAGIISWGRSLNDYSDPREVQKMRNQALGLSFSAVVSKHGFSVRRGLDNIVKHYILPHEHIQSKFIHENRFVAFSDLVRKYPLSMIRGYGLMPIDLLRKTFLRELQGLDTEQFLYRFTLLKLFQYSLFPKETVGSVSDLCRTLCFPKRL